MINYLRNFKNFYSTKQIVQIRVFFLLSIIGMILEILSVGLIIPLLTLLVEPTFSTNLINILKIYGFHIASEKDLILSTIFLLLFVFFIKTLFLTYVSFKQTKFTTNFKTEVTNKLFNIYLSKPYIFHLYNNSAKLIRNLHDSTYIVIITKSVLILMSEITVVFGIFCLMIFYEPLGTILTFLFLSISGYLFYIAVQRNAAKWGASRKFHEGNRIQWLQQGFAAIKDIKILNKLEYFLNSFSKQNKITNESLFKEQYASSLPRLWLEFFAIIGFIILFLILINLKKNFYEIIPIVGFFIAAAFRIMPSVTRVMNSIQNIKFGLPVVDTYLKEFKSSMDSEKVFLNPTKLKFNESIELVNINYSYPNSTKKILNNLNIKIPIDTSIGIYGESGVGKSTFLNVFLRLLEPQSGKILIDGQDIPDKSREWQNILGYVPQNVYLSDVSIAKNIALGVEENLIDMEKVKKCAQKTNLEQFIENLDNGYSTKVGELGERISGGQRQRIGIARALYNDTKILVLDEYTNSLDNENEKKIINEVNSLKPGRIIITVSHKDSTLKYSDFIYKLTYKDGLLKQ
jgi:ATP-binding cassette, subfamily B, bacterial PglK